MASKEPADASRSDWRFVCPSCGKEFETETDRTQHRTWTVGCIPLPDGMDEATLERVVAESDTVHEVHQTIRFSTRQRTRKLLKTYDLLDDLTPVGGSGRKSPQRLIEASGLEADGDADVSDGDETWRSYYDRGESDD